MAEVIDIEDLATGGTGTAELDPAQLAKRFTSAVSISSDKSFRFSAAETDACRTGLLAWYAENRRPLPWRGDPYDVVMAARAKNKSASPEDEAEVDDNGHDNDNEDEDDKDKKATDGEHTAVAVDEDKDKVYVTPPTSAYGTWVSEVMLQQTRVDTVVPYWYRWMERWPTLGSLAAAEPDEVNAVWAGLGYYRRAQQLLKGAKQVAAKAAAGQDPALPTTVKELKEVPGIGPYTAGAISSIANSQAEPIVDGNVLRVMARLRALRCELSSKDMETHAWALAADLVDPKQPGDFNQAVMELGATVCKPTNPDCGNCPVKNICQARRLTTGNNARERGEADENGLGADGLPVDVTYFPVRAAKKRPRELILSVGVLVDASAPPTEYSPADAAAATATSTETAHAHTKGKEIEKRYLFVRRPAGGLLQNQWEFPNVVLWEEAVPARARKAATTKKGKDKGKVTVVPATDTGTEISSSVDAAVYPSREDVPEQPEAKLAPLPAYLERVTGCSWIHDPLAFSADEDGTSPVLGPYILTTFPTVETGEEKGKSSSSSIDPIVHVFSHQKHTMHVSVVPVHVMPVQPDSSSANTLFREVRWMSAAEICKAGVTSGCKKILLAVEKAGKKAKKGKAAAAAGDGAIPGESAKRKATAEGDSASAVKAKKLSKAAVAAAAQPAISNFFAKKL